MLWSIFKFNAFNKFFLILYYLFINNSVSQHRSYIGFIICDNRLFADPKRFIKVFQSNVESIK